MKTVFLLAVTVTMTLGSAMPLAAATKVFLLGGQSNMAGVGGFSGSPGRPADSPIPSPYDVSQTAVKFWSSGWVNLQSGFGFEAGEFGPEVTFGYTLHNTVFPNDNIYLVKYGASGTNLAVDWNPNGSGPCYNTFKANVNAALQDLRAGGLSPVVAGMIWMQGESDTVTAALASAYAANLTGFIGKVRSDFATPDMPFVIGRILPDDDPLYTANADVVRAAQMAVASQVGHSSWVNTDDLELAYHGHYGTQGQIDLGIRFANQFVETPEPSTCALGITGMLGAGLYGCRRFVLKLRTHRG